MTVSGLTPNQIYYFAVRAQDEEPNLGDLSSPAFATTQALEAVGVGTYDDTNAAWTYAGSWSTWSGTGPYNNSMHYTNASGATASLHLPGACPDSSYSSRRLPTVATS